MKRIILKRSMLLMLCFTLILGLIPNNIYGNTNYSIDYESYNGFTVPEEPILPAEEVHPKLWFNKSEISDLYNKRLQDDYAATLWNSISTSNYLTMKFPEVPRCESNSSFIHGYYGHMARIAKYNAFMFVMEGNQVHRQRAIEALMRAYDGPIYDCAAIDPTVSGSPIDETYRAMWAQNYAAAYDWVYHELTPEQNEVIREKLAYEAQVTNDNLFIWGPRPHNHRSKPAWGLGSLALVLSDHPDAATWLETGLRAANTNTSYFFSSDGVYREGSQYYIYSHINFVPFLYHYKNVSNVNHFEIFKPAFIWEFHVSNNNGWMPNFADSFYDIITCTWSPHSLCLKKISHLSTQRQNGEIYFNGDMLQQIQRRGEESLEIILEQAMTIRWI
ncbi:hypothetical protein [Anaerobacillus sp. CMMVII]|uniref:hypothetical protein n=1 Tax=Anaerobacillus sp. CMMVII TaxID=2755588 RepID=UPI0021B75248|nr:hypothetical protein [Anaerobacillus sp. CMMVII]